MTDIRRVDVNADPHSGECVCPPYTTVNFGQVQGDPAWHCLECGGVPSSRQLIRIGQAMADLNEKMRISRSGMSKILQDLVSGKGQSQN